MLTQCPECELPVSDKANACPHCGYPLKPSEKIKRPRKSNKRRRLPNGFGQISEIKNRNLRNPFRAMVTVGKTSNGRPICKPLKPESYFATYNDAYAALVEYNKNPYDLGTAITMQELYDKWLPEYEKTVKSTKAVTSAWPYCSAVYKMRVMDIRARHVKGCMDCEARVHIPGRFSVYNSLVTMLVCHLAGISDQAILDGLNKVQVKGRVEMLPVSKDYYLIIDYAHNEVSTRSVLTTLMEYHPKRLICVYGGGGNRSKLRRYDMGEVTGEMADLCVLTCDNPRDEEIRDINNDIKVGLAKSNGKYIEIDDRKEAIAYCMVNAQPGDMIVLLGKGHEDYQEIRGVKYHFDEREAVAEILEEIKEGKRVRTV